jgi:hypothetical protein
MMNNFIITTTINKTTIALKKYSNLKNWKLIVVGDQKTPHDYYKNNKKIIYLAPNDQEKLDIKLSDLIGWNCIARRNFGFILANKLGAKLIATVDDDNIPYNNWGKKIYLNKIILINYYKTNNIAFDPLCIFRFKEKIWHRGYPLQLISLKNQFNKSKKKDSFDIQANLWDNHPDIDAINRISLLKEKFFFKKVKPYFSNKISPFNSQNTIITGDSICDYFMFPGIGRMEDIWAAYYIQSIGRKVVFAEPTVYQNRNPHNLQKDFLSEILGYKNNLNLIKDLNKDPLNIKKYLPRKSYEAFLRYKLVMKKKI